MLNVKMKVKTKENQDWWEFQFSKPETVAEATELFGEESVFDIFTAGLDVKVQGIARNMFKAGKSVEEVEAAVKDFRPGSSLRRSYKEEALELLMDNAPRLEGDATLKAKIKGLFKENKFKEIIDELRNDA